MTLCGGIAEHTTACMLNKSCSCDALPESKVNEPLVALILDSSVALIEQRASNDMGMLRIFRSEAELGA